MNLSRPVFLLLGFASEYSLKVVGQLLRDRGERVIEVDFNEVELSDLYGLEVVLITSQHPARTAWVFRQGYGQDSPYNRYLSPMECMQLLNVRCSVFVPHDLEQPIITDEVGYLSFFDFYCSPYPFNPGLSLVCKPLYTGWVKHVDIAAGEFVHQHAASKNGVFFVNRLVEMIQRGGAARLLRDYAVVLEHDVPFKFPCWPGVVVLEQELEKAGAKVIPADASSTQVIAHSAQLFSNANGSVLAEAAYLGVPAHIVAPSATTLPLPIPKCRPRRPFDFKLLMNAIDDYLEEASQS